MSQTPGHLDRSVGKRLMTFREAEVWPGFQIISHSPVLVHNGSHITLDLIHYQIYTTQEHTDVYFG